MVAIKVIEHAADDASKLDGLRESLLSSNIQHPNVVGTYKASGCFQSRDEPNLAVGACQFTTISCEAHTSIQSA